MKILSVTIVLAALVGCQPEPSAQNPDHRPTPGEAAGRTAYEVQQGAKKAAKELSKDLKSFGHDAREGFDEQKRKDLEKKQLERKTEEK
jgi:hypothetical protein